MRTSECIAIAASLLLWTLGIAAYLRLPPFGPSSVSSKEAVLRANLAMMRTAIADFSADRRRPPASAEELLRAKYLRKLPGDPFTRSAATWRWIPCGKVAGVCAVRSGAFGYETW